MNTDVVIVGAGFAGLYALHLVRKQGLRAVVFEAAAGVGGTWNWNRYPGARCDVESLQYSYSFDPVLEQEWVWSERYAAQPEILRYIEHVAERFDLKRDIAFETRVAAMRFDETRGRWTVTTDRGHEVDAHYCVMATGNLSAARVPDIAGLDRFEGAIYHTGEWPSEGVDFAGKRVAVIGTGSSGIQAIPRIAEQAAQLTVFQRTPNYSLPAQNVPLADGVQEVWKAEYPFHRERARGSRSGLLNPAGKQAMFDVDETERQKILEAAWQHGGPGLLSSFTDIMSNMAANEAAAEFVRGKVRGIVTDPQVADALTPKDYPIGSKRICIDTGYFATSNRDNVRLVDLAKTPIEAITPEGIRTAGGDFALDAIVFATGFDAMTGALAKIDIRGRGGKSLKDKWAEGARTYLGLMSAGFPNLFLITGPGSPSVLGNVVLHIEYAVEWAMAALVEVHARGHRTIEADRAAEHAWVDHVREVAVGSIYTRANNWYLGANIPGKPRVILPYVAGNLPYRTKVAEIVAAGYRGFLFDAQAAEAAE